MLLESARRALPVEHSPACHALLDQYEQFLEHNEFELALDQLEAIGSLAPCRGGYWRDLERAARVMGLTNRIPELRRKFMEALPAST